MINIKEITSGLMKGNEEFIEEVQEIMMELNLKELMLDNGFIVHRMEVSKNDNYFHISDIEGTFELGLELFCTINSVKQEELYKDEVEGYLEDCRHLNVEYRDTRSILFILKEELEEVGEDKKLEKYLKQFINKYTKILEDLKENMVVISSELIDLCDELQENITFDIFIKLFNLKECHECEENEVNREENFIDNLMFNSSNLGKVVRIGIIENEKIIKEMVGCNV